MPKTYVRSHVRTVPSRSPGLVKTVQITMDNGTEFVHLSAISPNDGGSLESFVLPNGLTVADWLTMHPGFRILSYRTAKETTR